QCRVELACRQADLLICAADLITIDIDVVELVICADLLQLGVGSHQRLPIPQPNVVDRRAVALKRLECQSLFRWEGFDRDMAKVIGLLGKANVVPKEGGLQLQFIGLYIEAWE